MYLYEDKLQIVFVWTENGRMSAVGSTLRGEKGERSHSLGPRSKLGGMKISNNCSAKCN